MKLNKLWYILSFLGGCIIGFISQHLELSIRFFKNLDYGDVPEWIGAITAFFSSIIIPREINKKNNQVRWIINFDTNMDKANKDCHIIIKNLSGKNVELPIHFIGVSFEKNPKKVNNIVTSYFKRINKDYILTDSNRIINIPINYSELIYATTHDFRERESLKSKAKRNNIYFYFSYRYKNKIHYKYAFCSYNMFFNPFH